MAFEEGDTIRLINGEKIIILSKINMPFTGCVILKEDGEIIFYNISKFYEKKICKNILIEKDYNNKFINKSILSLRLRNL